MRVLLLDHELPSLGDGAGNATHALARGLASHGVRVDVVTAGLRDESDAELLWNGTAVSEGLLTVRRVRRRRGGALGYLTAAIPVVRRLLREEHYDVVHLVSSFPMGALLPFVDLGGVPLVVTLRGPDVPGYLPSPRPGHLVAHPITRWVWRRADRVIAVSESLGRLARRTLRGLHYAVIPNGADLARFRPRLRPAPAHQRVRCLAVARLTERKELDRLIRAVAMLERGSVELEIVGTGPREAALRLLAEQLGAGSLVTFTGALDHAAVAQRYREADLFTLVHPDPSAGTVFAEALASGLPIIGSAVGGVAELVKDGRNGVLVPPGGPRALADAIRRLAESPRARAEMGRRNRAAAEERLGWARITERHLSIYRGVERRLPARPLLAEQPSSTW